jgi:hypothetical protein
LEGNDDFDSRRFFRQLSDGEVRSFNLCYAKARVNVTFTNFFASTCDNYHRFDERYVLGAPPARQTGTHLYSTLPAMLRDQQLTRRQHAIGRHGRIDTVFDDRNKAAQFKLLPDGSGSGVSSRAMKFMPASSASFAASMPRCFPSSSPAGLGGAAVLD